MKEHFFVLILLLCSLTAHSQGNFKAGYIIKAEGDTTFGEVLYKSNKTSALSASFRKQKGQHVLEYSPHDLVGFGYIGNKYMESLTIGTQDRVDYKVFVEKIFEGKIDLFRYKNDYLFRKEGLFYLVTNRKLVELDVGERSLIYSDDDVRTIADLVGECQKAIIDQNRFKIHDRKLIELLAIYHQCVNEEYKVYKETLPWTKLSFGIFGGANTSTIKFESSNATTDFLSQADFQGARSIFYGFELNFSSPRITDAYELVTGFQLMKTSYYGFSELPTPTGSTRNDVFIDVNKLIIPMGLRYTFMENVLNPYIGLGVTINSHSSIRVDWVSETIRDNLIVSERIPDPFENKKSHFGSWISVGIQKQISPKLNPFAEFKYEKANGLFRTGPDKNFQLDSSISNVQFLIGIRF